MRSQGLQLDHILSKTGPRHAKRRAAGGGAEQRLRCVLKGARGLCSCGFRSYLAPRTRTSSLTAPSPSTFNPHANTHAQVHAGCSTATDPAGRPIATCCWYEPLKGKTCHSDQDCAGDFGTVVKSWDKCPKFGANVLERATRCLNVTERGCGRHAHPHPHHPPPTLTPTTTTNLHTHTHTHPHTHTQGCARAPRPLPVPRFTLRQGMWHVQSMVPMGNYGVSHGARVPRSIRSIHHIVRT